MKKVFENKKVLLIVSIVLFIALIVILFLFNANKPSKIECSRNVQMVEGIDLDEDLTIMYNKKNKISRIIIDKYIKLDGYYQQFDTHKNAIYDHMNNAYKYLPEKTYKVTKVDDGVKVSIDTKKEGVILDNLEITRLSQTDRKDIKINSSNILESSSSTYKIGDEYKREELIKKIEGLGYTCKK